jgi:hypothetical protein
MALILAFNVALQIVAAFVIFVFGYVALLISIIAFLLTAKVIYDGAEWIRAHARKAIPLSTSISSDVGIRSD